MKNACFRFASAFTLLVLAFSSLSSLGPAYSQNNKYPLSTFISSTRDQAILDALYELVDTPAEGSLKEITGTPVRVFFKNLNEFNRALKNYDALSWLSPDGQHVIFINMKHKNAPKEALAAIIAHEVLHNDPDNSVQEEITGWTQEAIIWQVMKQRNPALARIPTNQYPLVDRLNRIESEYKKGTLSQLVRGNPGYQGLPETSPGFDGTPRVARGDF